MEELRTIKLSWGEVSECISKEISKILRRTIECKAKIDDMEYWNVQFRKEKIKLSELFEILEFLEVDEFQRKECLTESVLSEGKARELNMEVSEILLKQYLGFNWEKQLIDAEFLGIIEPKDVSFKEINRMEAKIMPEDENKKCGERGNTGLPQAHYLSIRDNEEGIMMVTPKDFR